MDNSNENLNIIAFLSLHSKRLLSFSPLTEYIDSSQLDLLILYDYRYIEYYWLLVFLFLGDYFLTE